MLEFSELLKIFNSFNILFKTFLNILYDYFNILLFEPE